MKINLMILAFALVACASTNKIEKDIGELHPLKGDSRVVTIDGATRDIVITSFKSNLEQPANVWGEARTGIQYTKVPLVFNESPFNFFQHYAREGFIRRNLTITADAQAPIKMGLTLNKLWVEEVIEKYKPETAKCMVEIEIVMDAGRNHYRGKFSKNVLSDGNLTNGSDKLAPTLASCMNLVLNDVVSNPDFLTFVKNQ